MATKPKKKFKTVTTRIARPESAAGSSMSSDNYSGLITKSRKVAIASKPKPKPKPKPRPTGNSGNTRTNTAPRRNTGGSTPKPKPKPKFDAKKIAKKSAVGAATGGLRNKPGTGVGTGKWPTTITPPHRGDRRKSQIEARLRANALARKRKARPTRPWGGGGMRAL